MEFRTFSQIIEQNSTHKTTLRHGDTLHVIVASTEDGLKRMVDEKREKLLRANGPEVTDADGHSVWIGDEIEHPLVWNKDGNRVKANRIRYEKDKEGRLTKHLLKKVWVSMD